MCKNCHKNAKAFLKDCVSVIVVTNISDWSFTKVIKEWLQDYEKSRKIEHEVTE